MRPLLDRRTWSRLVLAHLFAYNLHEGTPAGSRYVDYTIPNGCGITTISR
jgi:hypothetical protein